jgi:spore coat protein JC
MWVYEKKLEFPVKIKKPNPKLSKIIITQYGGPDGELGAAIRYLTQKFSMVTPQAKAVLNDIGTEELAHLEIIGAICSQLTTEVSMEEIKAAGLDTYYVDHGTGIYPQSGGGTPFSAETIQSTGNPIVDLYEDMAAEQKALATYDYILNIVDDVDVAEPIKFLRQREVVHFQRFGEALRIVEDYLSSKRLFCIKNTSVDDE